MIGIAILLVGAAVAFAIARWRRLPVVPFMLAAGVALNVLGLAPSRDLLQDSLQLGLVFLVFAAGIELNPRRVGSQGGLVLRIGVAQLLALGVAGFAASWLLGNGARESIYLALAVAASSTLLVVRLLQQRRQMFEPFGRMVLGVLLLQDLLVIVLLPVLAGLPEGFGAVARGLVASLILVAGAFAYLRWVAPLVILRLHLDDESLVLVTLATLFVFIGIAVRLVLPTVAGAFLAGFALSGYPVNGIVRGQLASMSDFFMAVFFTGLGAIIQLPEPRALAVATALTALVVLVTPLLVTIIAEAAGLSARAAIDGGLLLAQTSEFSLVIVLHGIAAGHVSEQTLTVVTLVTITTMFLTPLLATNRMTWRLMALHPLRRAQEEALSPTGHVVLIGCGENGMPLLETLLGAGRTVVVVDDDPAVIEQLREGDVPCIHGDGSDFDVLRRARAREAAIVVSTMRRPRDNIHLLDWVGRVPVLVRVFEDHDAESVRRHGGIPISYAEAATEDFLMWLDQAETMGLRQERRTRPRLA